MHIDANHSDMYYRKGGRFCWCIAVSALGSHPWLSVVPLVVDERIPSMC